MSLLDDITRNLGNFAKDAQHNIGTVINDPQLITPSQAVQNAGTNINNFAGASNKAGLAVHSNIIGLLQRLQGQQLQGQQQPSIGSHLGGVVGNLRITQPAAYSPEQLQMIQSQDPNDPRVIGLNGNMGQPQKIGSYQPTSFLQQLQGARQIQ